MKETLEKVLNNINGVLKINLPGNDLLFEIKNELQTALNVVDFNVMQNLPKKEIFINTSNPIKRLMFKKAFETNPLLKVLAGEGYLSVVELDLNNDKEIGLNTQEVVFNKAKKHIDLMYKINNKTLMVYNDDTGFDMSLLGDHNPGKELKFFGREFEGLENEDLSYELEVVYNVFKSNLLGYIDKDDPSRHIAIAFYYYLAKAIQDSENEVKPEDVIGYFYSSGALIDSGNIYSTTHVMPVTITTNPDKNLLLAEKPYSGINSFVVDVVSKCNMNYPVKFPFMYTGLHPFEGALMKAILEWLTSEYLSIYKE